MATVQKRNTRGNEARSAANASRRPKIEQPKPPTPNTALLAKSQMYHDVWLEGDPSKPYDEEGNFAVLVGPISMYDQLEYAAQYPGHTIENDLAILLELEQQTLDSFEKIRRVAVEREGDASNPEEGFYEAVTRMYGGSFQLSAPTDEQGRIQTLYGKSHGSPQIHLATMLVFLLTRHGQILGRVDNAVGLAGWELGDITRRDIETRVNLKKFRELVPYRGAMISFSQWLLHVTGINDLDPEIDKAQAAEEESEGNPTASAPESAD